MKGICQRGCLVTRRLSPSLDENLRSKEDEKEEMGEEHFALLLSLSHGLLRFVTSHSGFALLSAPEQEPVPTEWS